MDKVNELYVEILKAGVLEDRREYDIQEYMRSYPGITWQEAQLLNRLVQANFLAKDLNEHPTSINSQFWDNAQIIKALIKNHKDMAMPLTLEAAMAIVHPDDADSWITREMASNQIYTMLVEADMVKGVKLEPVPNKERWMWTVKELEIDDKPALAAVLKNAPTFLHDRIKENWEDMMYDVSNTVDRAFTYDSFKLLGEIVNYIKEVEENGKGPFS